jgi:hypothetical protein
LLLQEFYQVLPVLHQILLAHLDTGDFYKKERRADNHASVVLPVVVKVVVKEVNINGKIRRVIIITKVGSALALIVATLITNITASYYTRFRTTRFYTTSKAIGKGVVIYRRNYILSGFN